MLEQQPLIIQRVSERLVRFGWIEPGASAEECIAMANTTLGKVTELGLRLADLRDAALTPVLKTWPGRLLLRFVDWYPWLKRRPWVRDL